MQENLAPASFLELRVTMNKDVQALVFSSTIMSIFLSIYLFATGKRETGIFIGLWAPTIMALGIYSKLDEHIKHTDESTA